jgi:hypothetical protein
MKAGDRDETCSLYGEMRNAYKILVGKPEGRHFGRDRFRWGRILK